MKSLRQINTEISLIPRFFGASSSGAYDPVLQLATHLASVLRPWLQTRNLT